MKNETLEVKIEEVVHFVILKEPYLSYFKKYIFNFVIFCKQSKLIMSHKLGRICF